LQIGGSLVLAGKPGTGKSHLAASIMHALMPKYGTRYMTCMDMIRSIRDTWRKGSEMSETQVLNELTKLDLLVIDEVGVQYGTDGEQTIIFDILDRRYREEMPVVLLTNQDAKGFREFIGDRCHDRLKEVGRWVPFDWDSYRTTARKGIE
jgi:DNA replication protein DnaC